ncbi:MAG: DUF1800 domain-containing protein [Bosea sp. (in: a-proteobacteria)]
MATPRDPALTTLALHRFGLGARPGDLARIGADARDLFIDEVKQKRVVTPQGIEFQGVATLGPAFQNFQEKERLERETRRAPPRTDMAAARAASRTVIEQPAQQAMMGQGMMGQPMANPAAQPMRDMPPLPQRVYREEVVARVRAGLEPLGGFPERLVHFWSNHFCVSTNKGTFVRAAAGAFEREAIRPHVLGRFADMLLAVESHPAMLFFLDNQQSIGPGSRAGQRRGRGLNENLAREILELHTLGVAGGYTQGDVTALARIITGWSVAGPGGNQGTPGTFIFNANLHEPGEQKLLAKGYLGDSIEKGRTALADIARHPSTAQHIARKLARHFVADDPSASLVAKLAKTFRDTDGDLSAVSLALLNASEAWQPQAVKMRSPQEFLLAAARAYNRKPETPQILGPLNAMGQPLWQPTGPNGFPDNVASWASPEGIKTRMDVAATWARQAAGGGIDPRSIVDEVLGALASPETRQAVARAESKPQALAILLLSPEFQRR